MALLELLLPGAGASNGENSLKGLRLVQRIRSKGRCSRMGAVERLIEIGTRC